MIVFSAQLIAAVLLGGVLLAKIDQWDARRDQISNLLSNDPQRWDEWTLP